MGWYHRQSGAYSERSCRGRGTCQAQTESRRRARGQFHTSLPNAINLIFLFACGNIWSYFRYPFIIYTHTNPKNLQHITLQCSLLYLQSYLPLMWEQCWDAMIIGVQVNTAFQICKGIHLWVININLVRFKSASLHHVHCSLFSSWFSNSQALSSCSKKHVNNRGKIMLLLAFLRSQAWR